MSIEKNGYEGSETGRSGSEKIVTGRSEFEKIATGRLVCEKIETEKIDLEEFYKFVEDYGNEDTDRLRLKYSAKKNTLNFPLDFALVQIESRRKSRKKIPGFLSHREFLFPSTVAAEQASNEAVARYHASLIDADSELLDLTSGLGIDDMTFARKGIRVTACEIVNLKCDILRHNASILGLSDKINVKCIDSIEFLNETSRQFDLIFADPARRGEAGKRVHALSDCQPDIMAGMPLIMQHTDRFLVKCSPLLDLSLIINTVDDLYRIHVVCFRGECKEVLIEIRKEMQFTGTKVVDLDWDKTISIFSSDMRLSESASSISYACRPEPSDYKYLYEPNAGVMKTGDWIALQQQFPDMKKADKNTHLFLSDTEYANFPGRKLTIGSVTDKKALRQLKGQKLNIVSRNHPLAASVISQRYGIISAGNDFLYAFKYKGTPVILTAES